MCFWMTCKSRIFVTHQIHSKFATVWTATLKITSCNFFHLFFFLFPMSLHYLLILLALCSCAFHCKKMHTYYILLNHTSLWWEQGTKKIFFYVPFQWPALIIYRKMKVPAHFRNKSWMLDAIFNIVMATSQNTYKSQNK